MVVDAWRINKDELGVWNGFDAHETGAGRLGLGGHNGHFFPNQGIQQGRLADIWPTDKRDKTALMRL